MEEAEEEVKEEVSVGVEAGESQSVQDCPGLLRKSQANLGYRA